MRRCSLKLNPTVAALLALVPAVLPGSQEGSVERLDMTSEGELRMQYRGIIGQEFTLEKSDELGDSWAAISTANADSFGVVTFMEPVEGTHQFYRVLAEPVIIPRVYSVEHTGAAYDPPPLPAFEDLPEIVPLTDPFAWSDGSGRISSFADWARRRSEIKAELEEYEIGPKPPRPENMTASYANGTLTVTVTVGDESLTLTSPITLPSGDGPFPAIIGLGGGGSGSLPGNIFSSRDIAMIPFNFAQVVGHRWDRGTLPGGETPPIYRLYPDQTWMGDYAAWSWGVSRLIDGLEMVQDELPINLERLAISGCSFAGKMALWAGAMDERIALTIAHEPGGGGAAAWRVSEMLQGVEKLGATNNAWFMQSMFRFSGYNVFKLPTDHHELMAMVAPRALLFLGNESMTWLAEESGYVSSRAAHQVWKAFGIGDRFGFSIQEGHQHCAVHPAQLPAVEAFVDKFLLDVENVDTSFADHPFPHVNYERWFRWWGTDEPVLPRDGSVTIAYEPECGLVGENWDIVEDAEASNGRYVIPKPGFATILAVQAGAEGSQIELTIDIEEAAEYNLFWRVNFPTSSSNSVWVKLNDGNYASLSAAETDGWEWRRMTGWNLEAGQHTILISIRHEGSMLDKLVFSTYPFAPDDLGPDAENLCN